ncbi:MAG: sensor histidine kinase [Acetatifactor sp.]|nr:sensor histidine kinase [Acetatifactor sp.]
MKFTFCYLREHLNIAFMQMLFVCVFAVVFYLYHLPLAAVLYPAFICFLFGCVFTGRSVYIAYGKHKELTVMQSLSESTMPDAFGENVGILERDYQQLILKLCGEMQAREAEMADSYREMMDYFTVWVHQIKTPIASMRLHLEPEDSKLSRRLKSELLRIEQYVEMVLTYFKMAGDSSDYVFRTVSLDKILRESIRKFRGDFIMKELNLIYIPSDETVVSDEKWLSFVVEQILSNALKYTNEGSVTISLEEPKTLCIRDTGIGIAPEDIPRVFEKGYTGGNGRENKRASGLGLYLCKEICDRLGAKISIDSEMEVGTTVRIDLSQYHYADK